MEDLGVFTNEEFPQNNNNKTNWWKVALCIIIILGALIGGFFIGRKTIKPGNPEIIYVPGDTVKVDKPYPVPVYVNKPVDTTDVLVAAIKSGRFKDLFPENVRDSIIYVTKDDSAAVLKDWATERFYKEQLFDIDTVGTATLQARVQYNRLEWYETTFVPVTKVITNDRPIKKYSPFIGAGITTMPTVSAQAGMFFNDKYGVSASYQYDWEINKHIVGTMFLIKF